MRESFIEKKVVSDAISKGWITFKWVSTAQRGVPDRLFFKNGHVVIAEFKAPKKKPTKYQAAIHKKLNKAGFIVHVIDDIEEAKKILC